MTVEKLIALLQKQDKNLEVLTSDGGHVYYDCSIIEEKLLYNGDIINGVEMSEEDEHFKCVVIRV